MVCHLTTYFTTKLKYQIKTNFLPETHLKLCSIQAIAKKGSMKIVVMFLYQRIGLWSTTLALSITYKSGTFLK